MAEREPGQGLSGLAGGTPITPEELERVMRQIEVARSWGCFFYPDGSHVWLYRPWYLKVKP